MTNIKLNPEATYYVRFSDYINEDLERGWSSWNFGQDGIEATEEVMDRYIEEVKNGDGPIYISGFEIWADDLERCEIKELYPGYWVLVDNVNANGGISGHILPDGLETLEDILNEVKENSTTYCGWGEGDTISSLENATVIYSKENMHIVEVIY